MGLQNGRAEAGEEFAHHPESLHKKLLLDHKTEDRHRKKRQRKETKKRKFMWANANAPEGEKRAKKAVGDT